MEYDVIQPPFTLDFRNMTRREAQDYFEWFVEQTPVRMHILKKAVQSSPHYESWQHEWSPRSLIVLGRWFRQYVEVRPRTSLEKAHTYANAPAWFRQIDINDWKLTDKTVSLVIDIGMYLSQIFLGQFPSLRLELAIKPKNEVNYQQPVIVGFKKGLRLNPVRAVLTAAYAFADKSRGPEELVELYNAWAERVA